MFDNPVHWLLPMMLLLGILGCSRDSEAELDDSGTGGPLPNQQQIDAASRRQAAFAESRGLETLIENSIGMRLILIPSGEYRRPSVGLRETPDLTVDFMTVEIAQAFRISETEVTQQQYESVIGKRPSRFVGSDYPVEQISWAEANEFCRQLSLVESEKAAGRVYRLPTEAEWEYVCRADSETAFSFGDAAELLPNYARYSDLEGGSGGVAEFRPNAWGVYDMHGNVAEWCSDWFAEYSPEQVIDPVGPESGEQRVARGGYWFGAARSCRSDYRDSYHPESRLDELGFRVIVEIASEVSEPSP